MDRSRNTILLAVIGFALLVFVGLNVAINRAQEPPTAVADEEQNARAAAEGARAPGSGSALVDMPAVVQEGSSSAKDEVTVGWSWTPEIQANPAALEQTFAAIRQAGAPVKMRIVNTDVDPSVPPGIAVNGRVVVPLPPSGVIPMESAMRAIMQTAKMSSSFSAPPSPSSSPRTSPLPSSPSPSSPR